MIKQLYTHMIIYVIVYLVSYTLLFTPNNFGDIIFFGTNFILEINHGKMLTLLFKGILSLIEGFKAKQIFFINE